MARAKRHYISGQIWHITHRCHKKEFLLKFSKDLRRWLQWLYKARKEMTEKWETYEEVAACLLAKIKNELKLEAIEGKQKLVGRDTGTEWEIDAKGVVEGGEGIVLIEYRRYTTSKQNQEKIAALAYRIHDTKAESGIMVSPLGLQAGAKKVADANNIKSIEINANSTPENFTMRFLNKLFIGITDRVRVSDEVTVTVVKKCKSCGNSFEQIKDEIFCPSCT